MAKPLRGIGTTKFKNSVNLKEIMKIDDLIFEQVYKNLFSLPIIFSIVLGMLVKNIFLVLLGAVLLATGYAVYSSSGNIILQALIVSCLAHCVAASGGFIVSKVVR
jgi:hypothetical protein